MSGAITYARMGMTNLTLRSNSEKEVWRVSTEFSYEQTEVRESLLSFGAEFFVFQFAIQTFKD